MTTTTSLNNLTYTSSPPPLIDPNNPLYLQRELKKIENTLKAVEAAIKSLDARLTAIGA